MGRLSCRRVAGDSTGVRSAAGCHVTGLDTSRCWEFTEFGIGCESCHGPALAHSRNPEEVKPFAAADDQVCGACHSRGQSPDGLPFPAGYRPGDTLTDHFTFTTDPEDFWPDGSARITQPAISGLATRQFHGAGRIDTSCASCHAVHDPGHGRAQLIRTVERGLLAVPQ